LEIHEIPLNEICCDQDWNCRDFISSSSVIDLAKSIKSIGLQQPIMVRPFEEDGFKYKITVGHRRYQAYKVLNKETIPSFIKDTTPEESRLNNLAENLERQDLNVLEEANSIRGMLAKYSPEAICKVLNKSRGWLQIRMSLLKLPEDVQQLAAMGIITQPDILDMYSMTHDEIYKFAKQIKEGRENGVSLTVKKLKEREKKKKQQNTGKRVRSVTELNWLQDLLFDFYGMPETLAGRCLGWARGDVSTEELFETLKGEDENWIPPEIHEAGETDS